MIPTSQFASWTQAEDNRLVAGRAIGLNYAQICRDYLPGRTIGAAKHRYERLRSPDSPSWRPETNAKRDTVLAVEAAAKDGVSVASHILAERTNAFFDREAARRGVSRDHVILSSHFGPFAAALWEAQAA